MKKYNIERQVITIHESELTNKQETDVKCCVVTKSPITLPPLHLNSAINTNKISRQKHTDTSLECCVMQI